MQNDLPDRRAPSSPRPPPTSDDIRDQLERLVHSPEFPSVCRGVAFQRYVTDEVLSGAYRSDQGLFDRCGGVQAIGAFKQDDPVVRIEARRLRRAAWSEGCG